jgi:hypothetical protein
MSNAPPSIKKYCIQKAGVVKAQPIDGITEKQDKSRWLRKKPSNFSISSDNALPLPFAVIARSGATWQSRYIIEIASLRSQ